MKNLIIFIILTLFSSCRTEKKTEGINQDENISKVTKTEIENTATNANKILNIHEIRHEKYKDTLTIDYLMHKKILEILKVLPKETMDSWEWTKEERIKTVDFIAKNNYLIDSTEMYNNIKYIKPNTLGIQVVDGFWTLSIFELSSEKYIIITNDIVGDGKDINTFVLNKGNLVEIEFEKLFGKGINNLLKNQSEECLLEMEDMFLTFDYNFSDSSLVKITSWGIDKSESTNCFKGNVIEFRLDKVKELFEIEKIYWNEE